MKTIKVKYVVMPIRVELNEKGEVVDMRVPQSKEMEECLPDHMTYRQDKDTTTFEFPDGTERVSRNITEPQKIVDAFNAALGLRSYELAILSDLIDDLR